MKRFLVMAALLSGCAPEEGVTETTADEGLAIDGDPAVPTEAECRSALALYPVDFTFTTEHEDQIPRPVRLRTAGPNVALRYWCLRSANADPQQVRASCQPSSLLTSCAGAVALAATVANMRQRGYAVEEVWHKGSYYFRPARGSSTILSDHAYALAIDLAGLVVPGRIYTVINDWSTPTLQTFARVVRAHFGAVLDPDNEPRRHYDHLHASQAIAADLLATQRCRLTVVQPTAGVRLAVGVTSEVRWQTSGVCHSRCRVHLYQGGQFRITLAADTANPGQIPFAPLPSFTERADYQMGVSTLDNAAAAFSDFFAIVASPGGFCTPNWRCEAWGSCSCAGTRSRHCEDMNRCQSAAGQPPLTEACAACGNGQCDCAETCASCAPDCGPCASPSPANAITCALLGGSVAITFRGKVPQMLMEPLPMVSFIAIGSDLTGWSTSFTPPRYSVSYQGEAVHHTLVVPAAITRFNLWAANQQQTSWFDLRRWETPGDGCRIVPDGRGGLVIVR